jgi:hypothetical protein
MLKTIPNWSKSHVTDRSLRTLKDHYKNTGPSIMRTFSHESNNWNDRQLLHGTRKAVAVDFIVVLLTIIVSGYSLPIFLKPAFLAVPVIILFSLYLDRFRGIWITKKGMRVFAALFFLMASYVIKFWTLDPLFTMQYISLVLISFCVLSMLGYRFFLIYEEVIYYLSLFSLFMFALQLASDSFMHALISFLQKAFSLPWVNDHFATILIYTYNQDAGQTARNCGFTWEPGPFSLFVCLAIIIHLLRSRFVIDKRFIVLSIAVFTTQSSTGFIAYFVMVLWLIWNRNKRHAVYLLPLAIGLIYFTYMRVDFLGDKIQQLYETGDANLEFALRYNTVKNVSIGRFSGILLNWEDFKRNPILGYGGHLDEERLSSRLGAIVTSTSGLGNWFAQFGIVGTALFLILWYRSLKKIVLTHRASGTAFLLILILVMGFGFNIIYSAVFFCFMLSGLFDKQRSRVERANWIGTISPAHNRRDRPGNIVRAGFEHKKC